MSLPEGIGPSSSRPSWAYSASSRVHCRDRWRTGGGSRRVGGSADEGSRHYCLPARLPKAPASPAAGRTGHAALSASASSPGTSACSTGAPLRVPSIPSFIFPCPHQDLQVSRPHHGPRGSSHHQPARLRGGRLCGLLVGLNTCNHAISGGGGDVRRGRRVARTAAAIPPLRGCSLPLCRTASTRSPSSSLRLPLPLVSSTLKLSDGTGACCCHEASAGPDTIGKHAAAAAKP